MNMNYDDDYEIGLCLRIPEMSDEEIGQAFDNYDWIDGKWVYTGDDSKCTMARKVRIGTEKTLRRRSNK